MNVKKLSLQDFSTVHSHVMKYSSDYNQSISNAFYYFVLDLVLGLQDDEIIELDVTKNNINLKIIDEEIT